MWKLPLGRLLLLGIVVAAGIAVAWGSAVGFAMAMVEQARVRKLTVETVYLTPAGEPVVYRRGGSEFEQAELFDLDGKARADLRFNDLLQPQYSSLGSISDNRSSWISVPWRERIACDVGDRAPKTAWYLIHDGHVNGFVYGVGYELQTNRRVGYFGQSGFRDSLPPPEDWFRVSGSDGLTLKTTSPTGVPYIPNWTNDGHIHLLADGKLWNIDLANRKVHSFGEFPDALGLSWAYQASSSAPDKANLPPNMAAANRLLVRSTNSCTIVDPSTGETSRYALPPDLHSAYFAAVRLPDQRLRILDHRGRPQSGVQLWQIELDGPATKGTYASLATYAGADLAELGWRGAMVVPSPAVMWPLLLLLPFGQYEPGAPHDYSRALSIVAAELWPAILVVTLIGVALAILAYRRQKQFGLPGAAAWAVFCFALGVPGWLAYRFLWPWPPVGTCPSCERQTPLDRPACLDCGRSFPPPRLTGAEVFA